jgi:hypothetical protein
MKTKHYVFTGLLILFAPYLSLAATLSGHITDLANGYPIINVSVSTINASTHTDNKGYYEFNNLGAGMYAFTFSKDSYETITLSDVMVYSSKPNVLDVQMNTPGVLNITTESLPSATVNEGYNARVQIKGGAAPFSYALANGLLPPGLTMDKDYGNISGTPQMSGSNTFMFRVTDAKGMIAEKEFTIITYDPLIIKTQSPLPRAARQKEYLTVLTASGGKAPYSYMITSGELPEGIEFVYSGSLSGRPEKLGTYNFVIAVSDASGRQVEKLFYLEVIEPLSIVSERLDNGIVGKAYNKTLYADGGYGAYYWEIYSGRPPLGLYLDESSGTMTGMPKEETYGTIVIAVRDDDGNLAFKDFILEITDPLDIITTTLPNARKDELYSELIRVRGGISPLTFSIQDQLPKGLVFDAEKGIISGTPVLEGLVNFKVTVIDSTYPTTQSITRLLSIKTTSEFTIISSTVFPQAQQGLAINPFSLVAVGGESPFTWRVMGGSLPQGITLDAEKGILSGTPLDYGDRAVIIEVTDINDNKAQKEFIWHIADDLVIETGAIPDGAKDVDYSFTLSAKGGVLPYQWQITSGELLQGLTFDPETGIIQGVPEQSGQVRSFTVKIIDSDNPPQKDEMTYHFEVKHDELYIFTKSFDNGRVDQSYKETIRAYLGYPPYSWRVSNGILPPGVSLIESPNTATLEGIPEKAGNYIFSIEVCDSDTPATCADQEFQINMFGEVVIETDALDKACAGQFYSDSIVVTGGVHPYTWKIIQGSLPPNLSLDPQTGRISGIPMLDPGQHSIFTVRVMDSENPYSLDEHQYVIYGNDCSLTILTTTLPKAMQNEDYEIIFSGTGGIAPYTWQIVENLPTGLIFNDEKGILSGQPTECGLFNLTVKINDFATIPNSAARSFQLDIVCSNDYSIFGTVEIPQVTLTLNGENPITIQSDDNGNFEFQHLENGDYTITPEKPGYMFTPASQTVTIHDQNINDIIFSSEKINQPPLMPSNPSPEDQSMKSGLNPLLSWACNDPDNDELTYMLYLGTQHPLPLVGSDIKTNQWQADNLMPDTTYDWQIKVIDTNGAGTLGPVWHFKTQKQVSEKPDWPVVENLQFNMNIIALLSIDDNINKHADTVIAAFAGDECRGQASPEPTQEGLVFLTISSNMSSGEDITFKVWDANTEQIIVMADVMSFENQAGIGTLTEPYIFKNGQAEITLNFAVGYHWFSINVMPEDSGINHVFKTLTPVSDDRLIEQVSFAVYNGSEWVGSLKTFNPLKMYKIKISTAQECTIQGQAINLQSQAIGLKTGYNWIGYSPQFSMNINNALNTLSPQKDDRVISQTQFAVYDGNAWVGSLKILQPGNGYIIKVSQDCDLIYPAEMVNQKRKRSIQPRVQPVWTPLANQQFNMSVIAVIKDSEGISKDSNDILAAFVDGECRGIASPDPSVSGFVFLTIGSNAGSGVEENVTFKVYRANQDKIIDLKENIPFENQGEVGTLDAPWTIMISEMNEALDVNKDGVLNLGDVIYLLHIITGIQ